MAISAGQTLHDLVICGFALFYGIFMNGFMLPHRLFMDGFPFHVNWKD